MARRASACGHVDNARAFPNSPQAQKKQQINLVVSERKCSGPARHIQTTVRPGSHDAPPLSLRHLCADSHSHPHGVHKEVTSALSPLSAVSIASSIIITIPAALTWRMGLQES